MDDELLTTNEVAEILKVTAHTVWKWKQEGKLNFVALTPRSIRFKMSDIKQFIESDRRMVEDER